MRTRQHETTEMLEQKKTNSKIPVGPTKDIKYQSTLPKIKFQVSLYAGTIIDSEA